MMSNNSLTAEEKTTYLRMALALQHIGVTEDIAERIVVTYEKILVLGGDFSINDAAEIEVLLDRKQAKKKLSKKKSE